MATNQFQIPPEMRVLAEKSVEQAKQAVEGFISAAQRTASALEYSHHGQRSAEQPVPINFARARLRRNHAQRQKRSKRAL